MKIKVLFQSNEEARYTTIKTVHAGDGIQVCGISQRDGQMEITYKNSRTDFTLVVMLGFYESQARSLRRAGHDFNKYRVGGWELEDVVAECKKEGDDRFTSVEHDMRASINFEDEDLVEPVISLYNQTTPFNVEVLSEEAVYSGHIVHVRVKSNDPMAMFLLGQIFGEVYDNAL